MTPDSPPKHSDLAGEVILECSKVVKTYPVGEEKLVVLDKLDAIFRAGEFIGILGVSGSGKTTLIHSIAGLMPIDSGEIYFMGKPISAFTPSEANAYRAKDLGLVFQFFELHEAFSALDNVSLPMLIAGKSREERLKRSREMLKLVNLPTKRHNLLPHELSGGEQQRVALARAMANKPRLLLADEPTGDLDSQAGAQIVQLLAELSREELTTVIVVTHDHTLLPSETQLMTLEQGKLLAGMRNITESQAERPLP